MTTVISSDANCPTQSGSMPQIPPHAPPSPRTAPSPGPSIRIHVEEQQSNTPTRPILRLAPLGMARLPVSPTGKMAAAELPLLVRSVAADDVESYIRSNSPIIFDIRPFNTFSAGRVPGASNMCIPTTLLKRLLYDLRQVLALARMDPEQRAQLLRAAENRSTDAETGHNNTKPIPVMIYDADSLAENVLPGLYQLFVKFLKHNSHQAFDLAYIDGGFSALDASLVVTDPLSVSPTSEHSLLPVPAPSGPPESPLRGETDDKLSFLSGFTLPSTAPTRQTFLNELKKNVMPKTDTAKGREAAEDSVRTYQYSFRLPSDFKDKASRLPPWLQFLGHGVGASDHGSQVIRQLDRKFARIEQAEQARLDLAISNTSAAAAPHGHNPGVCSPSALCPGCDSTSYKLPKGIENGHKNRYKNVWPYEHLRVKLVSLPLAQNSDDYFNANYIACTDILANRYIATQSPLAATFEDFWKTVWHNHINVVMCLNSQKSLTMGPSQENKYFNDCFYAGSRLRVENIDRMETDAYILRTIKLTKGRGKTKMGEAPETAQSSSEGSSNGSEESVNLSGRAATDFGEKALPSLTVYHFEYKEWPDFGVPASVKSILSLIEAKDALVAEHLLNNNIVVHCLAGCGRTGCFITLDMILDSFHNHQLALLVPAGALDPWGEDDLVYKAVQYQRQQRILMVQNLDQFIVCYEVIANYVVKNLL